MTLFMTTVATASYNPSLQIKQLDNNLWQGQPGRLMIISSDEEGKDNPLLVPETDDFLITAGMPVKLNTGSDSGLGYPVQLTPLKSGLLTLPPFRIHGSDNAISEAKVVSVKAPALSDDMSIQVKRSAQDIYLGQSVRLEFEWITSIHPRALKAVNILVPEMEHNSIQVIEPAVNDSALRNKPIGLPVGNRRVTGRWEKLEEKRVRIYFDYVLHPKQVGTYDFPQPVLLASVDNKTLSYRRGEFKGMRYPPHFDNNFFDGVRNPNSRSVERVMVVAEPFRINVRPLPDGAPEHFSGMVGRPKISVHTDRQQVSQGDAVKVELRVQHPDLEVASLPSLKKVPAFSRMFDIPVAADPVSYQRGEKVVRQTVFPDSPDISEIPPLVINYFDPDSGQYRDYITASVPLEVTPVKQFNFSDGELPDDIHLMNQVIASDKGVWAHLWGQSMMNKQSLDNRRVQVLLLLFLLIPPMIFFIKWLPMVRNHWQQHRGRTPLAQFRQQVQSGAEPLTQLGVYLSRRIGLPPARLNVECIRQQLSGMSVTPETIDVLCQWMDGYHQQFSRSAEYPEQTMNRQLLIIIRQLDRQLPDDSITEAEGVFS